MRDRTVVLAGFLLCAGLTGCAAGAAASSGGGCTYFTAFNVGPVTATADHTAASPGNQQKFQATEAPSGSGTGCVLPQYIKLAQPDWTSSDPLNVSVSSAKDETNGLATCTGATGSAVTLTATSVDATSPKTATVQLTCR